MATAARSKRSPRNAARRPYESTTSARSGPAEGWPLLRHGWPRFVRATTAGRIGQGCCDLGRGSRNRGQKQRNPPRQCRAGQEAGEVPISPFAPAPGGIWHRLSRLLPSRGEEAIRESRGSRAGLDPEASAIRCRAGCGRSRRAFVSGWLSLRPMLAAGWCFSWHLD
jgi:hypothetical protein